MFIDVELQVAGGFANVFELPYAVVCAFVQLGKGVKFCVCSTV